MRSGKMRHSNSTWSLSAWTNHYNKRKRKSSPEEPPEPTRRPSLVETVYDINRIDAKGRSLLFYAAQCDQPEVAVQLINAGCDANIADHHGNTPLHEAAEYGHIEIVNLLIEKGKCRLNPINALGQTPLMKAVANDNLQICKILIKAGCDKDSLDHLNRSALLIGLREGSEDSVLYLLKSGSDVNIVDGEGHSALYYAVFSTYLTSLLIAKKLMHTSKL
ncbi:hypothetical protein FSP39_013519 [Pinctada imbricata]|uniref:Uncharacterized protein n=1 Tax=Pinctada imbricata TaxID=66713 RepID=A0AA88XDA9_PINIB|nr:hypothetical protein FSP39_013519 [Pinctada imbricata]